MNRMLRIGNDPTTWWATEADADALWPAGDVPHAPVPVPVLAPLAGQLILNPRALGAVAVLSAPPNEGGWVPSDVEAPAARIYVPGAPVADRTELGYRLAAGTDVAALVQQVSSAFADGSTLHVPVADGLGGGRLVVNGAALSHVVICPGRT
jgi:hypothetical protein